MKHAAIPLTILVLFTLILPKPVHAAGTKYQSHPTTHTTSGGLSAHVTNPTYAYDSNNATYTYFDTGARPSGSYEVKSFSIAGAPTSELIAFVDVKVKYQAAAAADDKYRIIYWVDPSTIPTVLVAWTSSAHSVPTAGCNVWTSQSEPNDGTWSWTDVSNIRVVVETSRTGANDAAQFNLYEVWVTVYSYSQPTIYVHPQNVVKSASESFTISINVTDVNDLYGWQFQLSYNGTLLNGTSIIEGYFLNNSGAKTSFFNVTTFDDDAGGAGVGLVAATCTLLGDVEGTTGSGPLANITFQVSAAGSCNLDLHDTRLIGYAYHIYSRRTYDITHTAVDGTFSSEAVPEFPLGAAMEIALATVIVYIWFRRKGKKHAHVNYQLI